MQTNVMGVFYTLTSTIEAMMQRERGQVVAISSLASLARNSSILVFRT